jgi:hypothetical protein
MLISNAWHKKIKNIRVLPGYISITVYYLLKLLLLLSDIVRYIYNRKLQEQSDTDSVSSSVCSGKVSRRKKPYSRFGGVSPLNRRRSLRLAQQQVWFLCFGLPKFAVIACVRVVIILLLAKVYLLLGVYQNFMNNFDTQA